MSISSGHWEFSYKDPDVSMSDDDLDQYQLKLLEIRDKYKQKIAELDQGCEFYYASLPPEDNIFARFPLHCKRHSPPCSGWQLLWNPNIDLNKEKLASSLHNRCPTWQYKSTSKCIQQELMKHFGKYFHFFDDDDTHEYYIDSYYDLKYGFKEEDDEVPMYASSKVEEPLTYLHSLKPDMNSIAADAAHHNHHHHHPNHHQHEAHHDFNHNHTHHYPGHSL